MENLELLKKVRSVDAPPFLLTRIEAKILAAQAERIPVSWRWSGALAFGLLLLLNVFSLASEKASTSTQAEQMAQSFQLQTINQLYNE
jgi:hypothetical protein